MQDNALVPAINRKRKINDRKPAHICDSQKTSPDQYRSSRLHQRILNTGKCRLAHGTCDYKCLVREIQSSEGDSPVLEMLQLRTHSSAGEAQRDDLTPILRDTLASILQAKDKLDVIASNASAYLEPECWSSLQVQFNCFQGGERKSCPTLGNLRNCSESNCLSKYVPLAEGETKPNACLVLAECLNIDAMKRAFRHDKNVVKYIQCSPSRPICMLCRMRLIYTELVNEVSLKRVNIETYISQLSITFTDINPKYVVTCQIDIPGYGIRNYKLVNVHSLLPQLRWKMNRSNENGKYFVDFSPLYAD